MGMSERSNKDGTGIGGVFARVSARFLAPAGERLRRLFPASKPAGPTVLPPDPAKILFPAGDGAPDRSRGALGAELERSAREITLRQARLEEEAMRLAATIRERLDGEATLITQGLRFCIVAFWAVLAVTLAWISRGGSASWAPWIGPISPDDAFRLTRAFAILAGAGFIVAFAVAALVFALGKGDNNRVRARAAWLGSEAGAFALDFDNELKRLREAMDDRKENPAAAVSELSRMHLTALEAAAFFRSVQFLTDERDEAMMKFRGFLRGAGAAGASTFEAYLLGLLSGVFFMGFFTQVEITLPVDIPDFSANYPWAVLSILLGAFAFAIAGLIVNVGRGLLTAGAGRQARSEALDAVRSGFVSKNAPRIESVIQRIEDAVDVFQARLSGWRPKSALGPEPETETPAWRKPPEGPRFVETGFAATPKTFLAEAPGAGRKKRKPFLPSPIPGAE